MPAIAWTASRALHLTPNPIKFLSQPLKPHAAGFCLLLPSFLLSTATILTYTHCSSHTGGSFLVCCSLYIKADPGCAGPLSSFFPHLTQILMASVTLSNRLLMSLPLMKQPVPSCHFGLGPAISV